MAETLDVDARKLRLVVNLLVKLDPDINVRAIKFSVCEVPWQTPPLSCL